MEATISEQRTAFRISGSLSKGVYYSTLLGVFSAILSVYVGSTVFLFYFVMLFNLLLMWGFLCPLICPKWLGWFLVYLVASGLIGVWRGTDTVFLFGKQVAAIGLSALYFANFFDLEGNRVDNAWVTYAKLAYVLTLVALAMWVVQCWIEHSLVRLHGLTSEPSAYCVLTLPAYYWYAHQWRAHGRHRKEVLWITLGVALSTSSDGYLAAIFGLILLFGKRVTTLFIAAIVACGLGAAIYAVSPYVQLRVNDTVGALVSNNVAGTNLSTYALISNMFVTERVFEVHPILGNGLGSHVQSYHEYIGQVPGEEAVEVGWESGTNAQDASSLTLRCISELGLMGLAGILWFVLHFRVKGASDRAAISSAILTVFFQKLLRGGGYSNPEQFFFVMIYILNYRQFRSEVGREYKPASNALLRFFAGPEPVVHT